MNQIWIAFLTGLTAGGISCLAVQGGLLASSLAQAEENKKQTSTIVFLISKIAIYTIAGFLLGLFGQNLSITPNLQGWLQIFAGLYMLATVANLLNIHPIFRYVVIQPPKWIYKLIKNESQKKFVGPALLGALTILIPCGITQAVMILAIGTGNPILSAAIMFAFTLGTSPIFLGLGLSGGLLLKNPKFKLVAATLIFILGINSISAGNGLRGSIHTIPNYWKAIFESQEKNIDVSAQTTNGFQLVTINVTSNGYKSSANTLTKGVPVKLKLVSNNAAGCARAFTIPSLNISKILPVNGEEEIEFTPTQTGRLAFSCNMGMFTGSFQVI